MKWYVLDRENKTHREVADVVEWARKYERGNRHIACDIFDGYQIEGLIGTVKVSTVFLGIDHQYNPDSVPLLYETMVFGGEFDGQQERYSSWALAENGHIKWVSMVKESIKAATVN